MNEPLNALVLEAMLSALDRDKRDELIRKALEALITPPDSRGYGIKAKSPLQEAFDQAVYDTARVIVKDMLATDEIRGQVRTLVAAAVGRMTLDTDLLSERLANAITEAIRGH